MRDCSGIQKVGTRLPRFFQAGSSKRRGRHRWGIFSFFSAHQPPVQISFSARFCAISRSFINQKSLDGTELITLDPCKTAYFPFQKRCFLCDRALSPASSDFTVDMTVKADTFCRTRLIGTTAEIVEFGLTRAAEVGRLFLARFAYVSRPVVSGGRTKPDRRMAARNHPTRAGCCGSFQGAQDARESLAPWNRRTTGNRFPCRQVVRATPSVAHRSWVAVRMTAMFDRSTRRRS